MGPEKVNRDTSVLIASGNFERLWTAQRLFERSQTRGELYLNGMAFEQLNESNTSITIIYWVKQLGGRLPDTSRKQNPRSGRTRWTPNRSKKTKSGCGAVNHFATGILWVLGDRSAETFSLLWRVVIAGIATLRHRWVQSLSEFHWWWRPYCRQKIYDESREWKHQA